jgi:hypothetical protein
LTTTGIESSGTKADTATLKPVITASDLTGGVVEISFVKGDSDGINIYRKREGDADYVLIGRDNSPPFRDETPLAVPGKAELRTYAVVYVKKDAEIGQFSDDVVISCAP